MASLSQNSAGLVSTKKFNRELGYKNQRHLRNVSIAPKLEGKFGGLVISGDEKKQTREKWKARCNDDGSCGIIPEFLPYPLVKEIVQEFYKAFQAREFHKLEQFLSPNSVYQDLVLYDPHKGREDVMYFLERAREAMGQYIHLSLESVEQTSHLTATVHWHLQWKDKKIPYTNAYRYFTFERVEGRLLISQITGVEDLPIKPGELALKMLKIATTLFDTYPLAADMMFNAYGSEVGKHEDTQSNLFGRN